MLNRDRHRHYWRYSLALVVISGVLVFAALLAGNPARAQVFVWIFIATVLNAVVWCVQESLWRHKENYLSCPDCDVHLRRAVPLLPLADCPRCGRRYEIETKSRRR